MQIVGEVIFPPSQLKLERAFIHCESHPDNKLGLPSSHFSIETTHPSPQIVEQIENKTPAQLNPSSILHIELQPSPLKILPSSHTSFEARSLSPQTDEQREGIVPIQVNPYSI